MKARKAASKKPVLRWIKLSFEMGESSKMRSRLTKLDAQLKEQMNRIIETRSDGLTFHYKAIDQGSRRRPAISESGNGWNFTGQH